LDWLIWVGIIVVVIGAMSFAYRGEPDRMRARTRRHIEGGGKYSEAPDWSPGHGKGSGIA
jgi:hypothetical protein